MGKIERVPFPVSGTNDTVEMRTECGVAKFRKGLDGKAKLKGEPENTPCKLIASKDRGLFGVMVGEKKLMVSVRLDEARDMIKAADEACGDAADGEEGSDVPEGDSPQG